jgi:crotonobetainyl-CoA:carnitine CoA-transferase CaiB-like acyl-CoA transferase
VLIENFRPGTTAAMGLGPDIPHSRDPDLIIVRVSGWGQDGPYCDRPGFGTLVESVLSYAARTGFADREPALPLTRKIGWSSVRNNGALRNFQFGAVLLTSAYFRVR